MRLARSAGTALQVILRLGGAAASRAAMIHPFAKSRAVSSQNAPWKLPWGARRPCRPLKLLNSRSDQHSAASETRSCTNCARCNISCPAAPSTGSRLSAIGRATRPTIRARLQRRRWRMRSATRPSKPIDAAVRSTSAGSLWRRGEGILTAASLFRSRVRARRRDRGRGYCPGDIMPSKWATPAKCWSPPN